MSQPAAEIVLWRDGSNVLSARTNNPKEMLPWVKDALIPYLEREETRRQQADESRQEYFKLVEVVDWVIYYASIEPTATANTSKKLARLWQIPAVQTALRVELDRLRPPDLDAAAAATHMRLVGEQC